MVLADKLNALFLSYQAQHLWLAYSGGADSQVLLHLLHQLQQTGRLTTPFSAIHINHQLQADSAQWAQFCAQQCAVWNIPLKQIDLNLTINPGASLEAVAREQRYAAFSSVMQKDHYLLTAHHADDQAETLLLQLLRGAGPKGLAAMPTKTPFAAGFHIRPLLDISRDILRAYASAHQLAWIDDPSNQDTRFTRNYLRNDIIPLLKQRWPNVAQTLSRSASHCASAQAIIEEVAAQDLDTVSCGRDYLTIAEFQRLSLSRQQSLLRHWFEQRQLAMPSTIQLQRIFDEVIQARPDAAPLVKWPGVEVRRFDGKLFAIKPLAVFDQTMRIEWRDFPQDLVLPHDLGIISIADLISSGIRIEPLVGAKIEIRFRQGGESFKPPGHTHHTLLKNWFWQQKVPPWLRGRVPLIFVAGEMLVAVKARINKLAI